MQIVIFTYNRKDELIRLLKEVNQGHSILVIDDGSEWFFADSDYMDVFETIEDRTHTRFENGGKKQFWNRWQYAIKKCLESKHNDFLFLADDVTNVNMDMIKKITEQGWTDKFYAVNVVNDGRTGCWGPFNTGQAPFNIDDTQFNEVGFVDCGFVTNRHTLEQITIDPIPESWFDRPDKSSGVGHQLTLKMRKLGVKMLNTTPSLCYHGDHESKMHGDHRKDVPLISK